MATHPLSIQDEAWLFWDCYAYFCGFRVGDEKSLTCHFTRLVVNGPREGVHQDLAFTSLIKLAPGPSTFHSALPVTVCDEGCIGFRSGDHKEGEVGNWLWPSKNRAIT